jgi:hypothetical protein
MARSTYIYLVTMGSVPLAAFTVKHELESWVARNTVNGMTIWRMFDSPRRYEDPPVDITKVILPQD